MKKKFNAFYTTVTLSDFKDSEYINRLIALNIGMELALLTKLSENPTHTEQKKDLEALKEEVVEFKGFFDAFNIPVHNIRIHQPGGYAYYWFSKDDCSGFDFLKDFFSYCSKLGFRNFVIHTPYGNSNINQGVELVDYRKKLSRLASNINLEVEEISASNNELKNAEGIRFYNGTLFEQLMAGQRATILLDTNECGGVVKTLKRLKNLNSKGFEILSMHLHKDNHKFLTKKDVELLLGANYSGNLINEGFVREGSSFDKFIKTKSVDCIVPNKERIKTLKGYTETFQKIEALKKPEGNK